MSTSYKSPGQKTEHMDPEKPRQPVGNKSSGNWTVREGKEGAL